MPTYKIWQFCWKTGLAAVPMLILLLSLGFWQLQRAEEKKHILDTAKQQLQAEPERLNQYNDILAVPIYRRVIIEGFYDPEKYWLIDAKMLNGRLGYNVLMPVFLESGRTVLVDRGWVPAPEYRDQYPKVSTPLRKQHLVAMRKPLSDNAFVDERRHALLGWPHRILEVQPSQLSKQYGQKIVPTLFALTIENESAFAIKQEVVNMPPERHQAYAIQWFSMAFALIILWFFAGMAIINRDNK